MGFVATLDMALASLVETHKQEALYSYKKYRASTTYWSEADLCGC